MELEPWGMLVGLGVHEGRTEVEVELEVDTTVELVKLEEVDVEDGVEIGVDEVDV